MSTFVLVHGAWHGAWCWERLVPELETRGHTSIAMDLPVDDGSATFDDYARAVTEAARGVDGDVVLVGHSLGSMVIPLVATTRPASAMIFLCGLIPNFHGTPWDDAPKMEEPGIFDGLSHDADGSTAWSTLEAATDAFYSDCAPDDARRAFERLRHQNSKSLWGRSYPLDTWPTARRVAIICAADRTVTPAFSRAVCRPRLGVDPIEMPGGHSPFLARPGELADLLVSVVAAQ